MEEKKEKMTLQEWSMHYRQIIILLVSCLVALGIYGLANINKNEFPDFTIRQGIVVAAYPGVTAQEMEEQVTKPLEKYIFTYREVKKEKTISYSKEGLSIIQVELNDDLTDKDGFWSKFKHGVQGFKDQLPEGVLAIIVNDDFGDTSALLLAMESDDKTYRELNDYMNSLIDSLRMIPSVGKMTVFGMQHDQISIYLNSDKLSHYGISYLTIAQQLRGKGFVTTAGRVKNDGYKSPIYVDHALNKIYDVENTVIDSGSKLIHNYQLALWQSTTFESGRITMFIFHRDVGCRIWQLTHTECVFAHLLGMPCIRRGNSNRRILPDLCRTCNIFSWTYCLQCSICHRSLNFRQWYTRNTDTDRVAITCIEHIHQVCRNSCTWIHHRILLREVASDFITVAINSFHITFEGKVTCTSTDCLIEPVLQVHLLTSDIDIWHLSSINSRHHDSG